jgi:hypothetical protein
LRSRRSLSSRLIVYWLVGSLLAFFSVPATVHLPLAAIRSGDLAATNLDAWTTRRARSVVSDSLRRSADGRPYIEMTDALQRHLHHNPHFEFAAADVATGEMYAGSFDDLAAYLRGPSTGFDTYGANFHMAGDAGSGFRGVAWTT